MQAYGNDYIFMDAIHQVIDNPNQLAERVSNRHFGIGSDGLILVCKSDVCDFRMRIFDPDGTEAEMCGNGLRGTAKFAYYYGLTNKTHFTIETYGGNQTVDLIVEDNQVVNISARIGKPNFNAKDVPVLTDNAQYIHQLIEVEGRTFYASALSWGTPHTVIEIDDVDNFEVEKYGKIIEHLPCFPKRTNVTFAQVIDDTHIKIREWERGTGETLGCGTGCCSAVAVFHMLHQCKRSVDVTQPGGVLHVDWGEDGIMEMTGPSYFVCEGEFFDETH